MRMIRLLPAAILVSCFSLAGGAGAKAATVLPFTQAAFDASKQAGKPILVHIEASWCTTCAQQRPILAKLEAEPTYASLIVYNVDFDTQKDVVRAFRAQMQSTLIALHGSAEEARSTGDTHPASIEALVAKTQS